MSVKAVIPLYLQGKDVFVLIPCVRTPLKQCKKDDLRMSYSNYYAASQLFHGSVSSIMGTQLDVLMVGGEPLLLTGIWNELEAEVRRLDRMLNRFDPQSEVARINRDAAHFPVVPDLELWSLLVDCKRYHARTGGYFDITLGNFNQVLLNEADQSVYFFSETLHIDLGGIGKGYALLKMREMLERNGVRKALVNFGNSSILALGTHPCGEYWPVGLDNPYTKERVADLKLSNTSLSTSGNMPSHPCHIINPHTGLYTEERRMVSVIADDPVAAEVLTTTLMIAGEEQIQAIADKFEVHEKHLYKL